MQTILNRFAKSILERHNEDTNNEVRVIEIRNHDQDSVLNVPFQQAGLQKIELKLTRKTVKIRSIQFTTGFRNHFIDYDKAKNRVLYVSPYKGSRYIETKKEFDTEVLDVILPLLQI